MTSDSTPVFALEKEALKTEIETGLQVGVDHLEDKPMKRKPVEKYHNTRHLLKQYRKVAYAIQISESDMNVRMEMEHGTRLSTLEVNAELAGVDLSGSKLEGYGEVADLLGIRIDETHDWLKITVPAILPKRNQRDNQAFLTRPLRYALLDFLKENPMERFGSCAICIVHNYDEALGKRRIRDYDNIETKRYLDVIESMLLTNDSGLLCTVLQATKVSDRDCTEFYLMRPETLSTWAKNHIKSTTNSCFE